MPAPDYSAIYAVARGKLQKSEEQLPDTDATMVEETELIVPVLLAKVPKLPGDYALLSAGDKLLFDKAAGRIVATRLRPVLQAAANGGRGQVTESEIGDKRYRYAGYNGSASGSKKSVEEMWLDEAQEALAALPCLRSEVKPREMVSFFGLGGRRRADSERTGYRPVDLQDLLRPPYGGYGEGGLLP